MDGNGSWVSVERGQGGKWVLGRGDGGSKWGMRTKWALEPRHCCVTKDGRLEGSDCARKTNDVNHKKVPVSPLSKTGT